MSKKVTVEEPLAKAKKPAKLASAYHTFYEGKLQVMLKCPVRTPMISLSFSSGLKMSTQSQSTLPPRSPFV